MENYSGNFCFVPYPSITTEAGCFAANSCGPGGGQSGGGCYTWATSVY
jgi:hypothetical protein